MNLTTSDLDIIKSALELSIASAPKTVARGRNEAREARKVEALAKIQAEILRR